MSDIPARYLNLLFLSDEKLDLLLVHYPETKAEVVKYRERFKEEVKQMNDIWASTVLTPEEQVEQAVALLKEKFGVRKQ